MIGERFPNRFRRSAVDLQARAVLEANALIATIHHNKVNWPRPSGIDLRYKDPLAASASVLATCFNNHFQFSIMCVQKDDRNSGQGLPRARYAPIKVHIRL
jgi:hypothetical protein